VQHAAPVRPVVDRSDRSHQRPGQNPSPRQEYRIKEKKEDVKPTVDSSKAKADDVIQIGEIKVAINDAGKTSIVFGESISSPLQKLIMDTDHEASSSSVVGKYHQPRCCPPGLTHTQNIKLKHMRNREKREHEAEKIRDEQFTRYKPMIPQAKVWHAKPADQLAG